MPNPSPRQHNRVKAVAETVRGPVIAIPVELQFLPAHQRIEHLDMIARSTSEGLPVRHFEGLSIGARGADHRGVRLSGERRRKFMRPIDRPREQASQLPR
jgi:hypothetical protein